MKIHGFQKLTLLDYPGRTACTLFLAGCDLRCPFCHNSGLLSADAPAETDDAEVLRYLEMRRALLDGVAITGGEPLLSPGLPDLLRRIRALGYDVKLDTNGTHPDRLHAVLEEGLVQYVAMDVKNDLPRYAETVGIPNFDTTPIRESIRLLLASPVPCEFRTTAVRELHDENSFRGIGELIRGAERYYIQCFTDRDTVPVRGLHAPELADLQAYLRAVEPYVVHAELRGV